MNVQEALEIITNAIQSDGMTAEQDKALAIAQKALEKQIPKKPQKSESRTFDICPTCGKFINRREKSHGNIDIPRCKWCGQKLDWSDTK